ncbi:esterase-like activity of phytase family protein [Pseudalkalibacillus sp. A8]|uniref:esterase-like activity of phytase family protein n=1 Tax=Pseudalkalibacillus sp. A8 TaxID=3382641 RepID=UPI0038B68090
MNKINKAVITGMAAVCLSSFTLHTAAVSAAKKETARSVEHVRLIESETLPYNTTYKGTTVGGLSGITYNPKINKWLIISDDRSDYNPARFYEAKVNYNANDFQNIQLVGVNSLKQQDGTDYLNRSQYNGETGGIVADPESIRFDPLNNSIWYTSEGDRSLGLNPFIRQATLDGSYLSELSINDTIKMDDQSEKGFRNNLALEGSTFSYDGQTFWTSMEGPLLQDDTIPTPESGALSRITQYDREGNVLAEYAYPIDAIPEEPGTEKNADNGVTEILSINDHELFVLERASVQADDGSYSNYVRVYKVDINEATDIKDMESIKKEDVKPLKKELVINLNTLGLDKVDNVEGMTFGKKLPNGNDSLVLVSDNNFNDTQVTQFIAFEVIPED